MRCTEIPSQEAQHTSWKRSDRSERMGRRWVAICVSMECVWPRAWQVEERETEDGFTAFTSSLACGPVAVACLDGCFEVVNADHTCVVWGLSTVRPRPWTGGHSQTPADSTWYSRKLLSQGRWKVALSGRPLVLLASEMRR